MNPKSVSLKSPCEKCHGELYGFYHEAVSGDEATGVWMVECNECDHTPEENSFPSLKALSKDYEIKPEARA